jgi:hypothetical protein
MLKRSPWVIFFFGVVGLVFLYGLKLPSFTFLAIAWFAFSIGNQELKKSATTFPQSIPAPAYTPARQPVRSAAESRVELPKRSMPDNLPNNLKCPACGASIKPNDKQCAYCGSTLKPLVDLPEPAKLAQLEVGMSLRLEVPQKGELVYRIKGRLLYTELWQASSGAGVPWTPTGNYFAGFALEPNAYLLNWQDRFYFLEDRRSLTDMDINMAFMPYAKQFAQSNQTARVEFSYAGNRWQMVDIGRFAIEFEDGAGTHLHAGAIGRFIHASSGNRALVLDDFQSGGSGGQDTVWLGFKIEESNIHF